MNKFTVTYLIADFDGRGVDRLRTGLAVIQMDYATVEGAGRHLYANGFTVDPLGLENYIPPSAMLSVRFAGPNAEVNAVV